MTVNPEATEERTRIGPSGRAALWRLAGPWWLFLVTGIAWLIIAVMVLRFTPASVNTVGVLMGVLFLLGAFNEFLDASMRHSWRWAHVVMGVLFLLISLSVVSWWIIGYKALYFARAILLPIALAESGDRPPDLRAERSDRALHDLVACAVVFFQP